MINYVGYVGFESSQASPGFTRDHAQLLLLPSFERVYPGSWTAFSPLSILPSFLRLYPKHAADLIQI